MGNSHRRRLKEKREAAKRAQAEALKSLQHENEVRDELRLYLRGLLGEVRAEAVWEVSRSIRIHKLFEDAYRINFWLPEGKIWFSTFARYTKKRGFYYSDPSWDGLRQEITGVLSEKSSTG